MKINVVIKLLISLSLILTMRVTSTVQAEDIKVSEHPNLSTISFESRTQQITIFSTNVDSFETSLNYNSDGFSGTLNKQGNPTVVSGELKPAQTITAPTHSCGSSIPGKYVANGNWVPTGPEISCPWEKTAKVQDVTITLTRTYETSSKICPSPNKSKANYACTMSWVYYYDGSITLPASDTRNYAQVYSGTVTKPVEKIAKYTYTYNSSGQLTDILFKSGKKISYEYDKNGNLKKTTVVNP
ncbi:hypothetical protein C0Q44_21975 [Paenibacillus sp. PCH8]|uniref:RHS repeat domain-containing protein n=1 Tax=Paenibacillus sp. PCH8 TaxID=2066524 RepID=UPI000CF88635|nr:RHS repeat domain-containing protein [Paenibacillus sp. PCH8]PQP81110.1 hypothetical protein C0Q44_21975 [Paenibacillus sp. PCH8]